MIKYAVLNPANGTYTKTTSEQERDTLLAKTAWEFYLSHVHNVAYSKIIVNDDGSEQWSSPRGEPMLSPQQMLDLINQYNDT